MERVILHCDMNSFYASVELLSNPELREKPVAVCGDPESRHGIILAKNEAAKRFQIRTAETVWQARRKCPDLVLLGAHRDKYRHYSRLINWIYGRYTDLVEPFSIDESWLDLTGSLHLFGGDAAAVADEIRAAVRRETGLTLSAGVSFNKTFAKMCSDYRKPDATTVITRENFRELLWPLPVGALLFVGRAAERTLTAHGVRTIGDLARPMAFAFMMGLSRLFYGKYGDRIDLDKFMSGSTVLCLVSYLCISFAPFPVLSLAGCAVCGFSVGILWPGSFSKAAAAIKGGGTAMFAFLALAGDLGCSSGPTLAGFVSSHMGDNLKAGILAAIIFPVLMLAGIFLSRKMKQ